MNYEIFKDEVLKKIEELTKEDNLVVIQKPVFKNNGLKLDGLVIKELDSEIAPIIYINEWYEEFLKGKTIEEIADGILLLSGRAIAEDTVPTVPEFNWKSIKDKLYVSVINADANEELLKETPHRRIDDLAVIAKIRVEQPLIENASIRVTNTILPLLTKTKDEVLNQAISNTEKLDFKCRTMREMICGMLDEEPELADEIFSMEGESPMFVVTLPNGIDGASVLACKDALTRMVDKVGEDVYILPSSIQEVILISKSVGVELEDLQEMVREVNRNEVAAGEVLSDNVYQFDRKTKKLSIAKPDDNVEKKNIFKNIHMSM